MESSMESSVGQQSFRRKKIVKQRTGKREDTPLHSAARAGNLAVLNELVAKTSGEDELRELLCKQNQAGETPLFVAAEYGYVDVVQEMVKYHNAAIAGIRAKNGYDALHVSAKQGDVDVVKELLNAHPTLLQTVDFNNTTALHTAATHGHVDMVNLLLAADKSLALIAKSNGKTALHSAARNGHLEVVKTLLANEPAIASRTDMKGQTALHMAAKGTSLELVEVLLQCDPSLLNLVDNKGNTALHISARKGHAQMISRFFEHKDLETNIINKSEETALDTAEKMGHAEAAGVLQQHAVQSASTLNPAAPPNPAHELKQQVSDIKHEVHSQLEHSRQTRRRVQGIAKRIHKLHDDGLNNAINSNTVVAVLIATVAFAAIFTVPGEYVDYENYSPGLTLGEANIAHMTPFMIFFVFDSVALFISLAVVVVQTSVVVIEFKAKKQMMAIINKLMWVACVLISVAFLALCFIVVGRKERWLAIGVAVIGTVILVTTIGTMLYWVILHRIEDRKLKAIRSSLNRSRSWSASAMSEGELFQKEYKDMYAI